MWVGVLRPCRYLLQSSSITPLVLAVNGPALLHLAAAKNNVPCVAILIDAGEQGADVAGQLAALGVRRLDGMWVCSGKNRLSKPRSSMAFASSRTSMP